jgi:hypothetical protein
MVALLGCTFIFPKINVSNYKVILPCNWKLQTSQRKIRESVVMYTCFFYPHTSTLFRRRMADLTSPRGDPKMKWGCIPNRGTHGVGKSGTVGDVELVESLSLCCIEFAPLSRPCPWPPGNVEYHSSVLRHQIEINPWGGIVVHLGACYWCFASEGLNVPKSGTRRTNR